MKSRSARRTTKRQGLGLSGWRIGRWLSLEPAMVSDSIGNSISKQMLIIRVRRSSVVVVNISVRVQPV